MNKVMIAVSNQEELNQVNKALNINLKVNFSYYSTWFVHNINEFWDYNSDGWKEFRKYKHLIITTEQFINGTSLLQDSL